ncbi:hypothetical protein [Clostridium sp. YIM B02555]|uniref:hypothetical protein n=1 Tax=Clostridium sp. YIM B02555 TaxID=2911968 RepID=UPI001EEEC4E1|nr:hypothetical protein [Clostridium sp. YIM B02555]
MLHNFNNQLTNWTNIISLLSGFASIAALIISILAFNKSNQKANLVLKYNVYDSEKYYNGKYFEDGNGKIVFVEEFDDSKENVYGESWGQVTICRPGSELNLVIENKGNIPAKNIVMNFKFINMAIEFKENGYWRGISHIHAYGTWNEIRWEPKDNTVIHNGIPVTMCYYFNRSYINRNSAYIEVILSAENMKTKKFKIPVELK